MLWGKEREEGEGDKINKLDSMVGEEKFFKQPIQSNIL